MIELPLINHPCPKNIQWLDRIIRSFVSRHHNLRGYGFGMKSNSISEVLEYPYCWMVPTRTRVLSNDRTNKSGYSVTEITLEISISDKLLSDKTNNVDTISDVNEILMSLVGELANESYYVANNVSLVGDIDVENEWEYNDDIVNVSTATLTFRVPFNYQPCNIPVDTILIQSLQGYVNSGYITGYV